MLDLLITGGRVVTPGGVIEGSVAIAGGVIEAVGQGLSSLKSHRVSDAQGNYVIPGAIDPHVHFSMPFMDDITSNDFYAGTVAAACGGVTTVIDFVPHQSGQSPLQWLTRRKDQADPDVVVDYGLHSNGTDIR